MSEDSTGLELVSFRMAEQDFCIDIMQVREIRGWTQSTALPQSPDFVCGVINLRGTVLPVVDLSQRLGLGRTEPSARSAIIVAHVGKKLFGLLVDAVSEIMSISEDAIQPTPDIGSDDVRSLLRGIVTIDNRMISVITLDNILPDSVAAAA